VQEAFEQFKIKAKQEYEQLQQSLGDKHRKELEQQKEKYERMLDELRRNASSDKEFV